MEMVIAVIAVALAIENFVSILTTVDLLEPFRAWLEGKMSFLDLLMVVDNGLMAFVTLGWVKKLARCHFCMTFWLCGLASYLMASGWACLVLWFAMHRLCDLVGEFFDRYLNKAPLRVSVKQEDQGTGS